MSIRSFLEAEFIVNYCNSTWGPEVRLRGQIGHATIGLARRRPPLRKFVQGIATSYYHKIPSNTIQCYQLLKKHQHLWKCTPSTSKSCLPFAHLASCIISLTPISHHKVESILVFGVSWEFPKTKEKWLATMYTKEQK